MITSAVAAGASSAPSNRGPIAARAVGVRRSFVRNVPLILAATVIVTVSCQFRWSLATTTRWQCDEIPLLVRFTGLCGHVSNEAEARAFHSGFYTFYMGALRSLRAPKSIAALHTTTGFWANLSLHLFGATPGAGRLAPLLWSLVAILAAAWGAWLVARSLPAVCLAACFAALSPHAVAYSAQTRGYAEAMALAPALLIALDYYRRRPQSAIHALLILILSIQLSLTVYTLWIYWVAPSLLLAIWFLPHQGPNPSDRRTIRAILAVIMTSLILFMVFFTIDRWPSLTFTASHEGLPVHSAGDVALLLRQTAQQLLVAPVWIALLSLVGLTVLWRSDLRWWVAVLSAGILIPALFGLVNGSCGYPRTFGYLVVPFAILAAAGADTLLARALRRFHPPAVTTVAAVVLIGGSAWGWTGLQSRVRRIIIPDWGRAVVLVDREVETVGPRWFCQSPANHWQINWYRSQEHLVRCLQVPVGGRIEVILGTQRDRSGREVLFQPNPDAHAIAPRPLPDYLDQVPIDRSLSGVNLRRWCATRIENKVDPISTRGSMFVLIQAPDEAVSRGLSDYVHSTGRNRDIITFKPVTVSETVVWSFIIPMEQRREFTTMLERHLPPDSSQVHWFSMTGLSRAQDQASARFDSRRETGGAGPYSSRICGSPGCHLYEAGSQ